MKENILNVISQDGINLELLVATDVLKLNSLHYGYWDGEEGEEALTLANLRRAQTRYTERLIEHVPEGVHTILDVGCGIGDVARALTARCYIVTAISPDRKHARYFAGEHPGLCFHNVKFEDLDLEQTFDLVLMSESQNYFDPDIGFRQTRRYLRPQGYLLVCGMFKQADHAAFEQLRNSEAGYAAAAAAYGFQLLRSVDITEQVLPTVELMNSVYHDHVLPALNVLNLYLEGSSRLKRYLLQLYFRRELRRLEAIRRYYLDYIDPVVFRQNLRYLTQLYVRD